MNCWRKPVLWPGVIALVFTPGLAIIAVIALLFAADAPVSPGQFDTYTLHILEFSVIQAGMSTMLSVAFGLPIARAFARRARFPFRRLFVRLMELPLVIPVIVAVFGVTAVWGHRGFVNQFLDACGLPVLGPVYGLPGILLAHAFFNVPLAVRLLLPAWESVPGEHWRLASQLGMSSWNIFRFIELPRVRQTLPGITILIFLLCFTSFTVVLVLGGGPHAATLEVAIFYALRLEFDIQGAVLLALVQVLICAAIATVLMYFSRTPASAATEERRVTRPDGFSTTSKAVDVFWISLGSFWTGLPLIAVVLAGVNDSVLTVLANPETWKAAARSVVVGLGAGLLAFVVGVMLATTTRDIAILGMRPRLADRMELAGSQMLVVSPVVLGTGLFVLLLPVVPIFSLALPLAALVNGLVAVPYVLWLTSHSLRRNAQHYDRLCATLGLRGFNRIVRVEWPCSGRFFALAVALAAALGTGDLTAIALFGTDSDATLPLLIYRALGSYRVEQAAVLSLLLIAICLGVFILIERLGRVLSGR